MSTGRGCAVAGEDTDARKVLPKFRWPQSPTASGAVPDAPVASRRSVPPARTIHSRRPAGRREFVVCRWTTPNVRGLMRTLMRVATTVLLAAAAGCGGDNTGPNGQTNGDMTAKIDGASFTSVTTLAHRNVTNAGTIIAISG